MDVICFSLKYSGGITYQELYLFGKLTTCQPLEDYFVALHRLVLEIMAQNLLRFLCLCTSILLIQTICVAWTVLMQHQPYSNNCPLCVLCCAKTCLILQYYLLYNSCERGEQIVCLAPMILCCTGTTQILLSLETVYQQVMSAQCSMDFSICLSWFVGIHCTSAILQYMYHGLMCKPDFSLLGEYQPNLI